MRKVVESCGKLREVADTFRGSDVDGHAKRSYGAVSLGRDVGEGSRGWIIAAEPPSNPPLPPPVSSPPGPVVSPLTGKPKAWHRGG